MSVAVLEINQPLWGHVFKESVTLEIRRERKLYILSINHEPGAILGLENIEPKFEFKTEFNIT